METNPHPTALVESIELEKVRAALGWASALYAAGRTLSHEQTRRVHHAKANLRTSCV